MNLLNRYEVMLDEVHVVISIREHCTSGKFVVFVRKGRAKACDRTEFDTYEEALAEYEEERKFYAQCGEVIAACSAAEGIV